MFSKLKQIWNILFPSPDPTYSNQLKNQFEFNNFTNSLNLLNPSSPTPFTSLKFNSNACLHLRLYSAENGLVLEVANSYYEGGIKSNLFILNSENLGEQIQQIVLVELLKK